MSIQCVAIGMPAQWHAAAVCHVQASTHFMSFSDVRRSEIHKWLECNVRGNVRRMGHVMRVHAVCCGSMRRHGYKLVTWWYEWV